MAVYWGSGIVTDVIAIAYKSDVVGQYADNYIVRNVFP